MFNEAQVSLVGFVASEPNYLKVGESKIPKLTMRVGWTTRFRDSATGEWVDGNRSFVTVICWRQLAENLSTCLRRGDPVVVRGRLDVRSFTGRDGQRRTAVDVDANALGPDLNRGVAGFRRVWPPSGKTAEQQAAADQPGDDEVMADGQVMAGGDGPDDEAALVGVAGAGPIPEGPADEEIFDDSAIEALAQETERVTAPF
jgi:single-strand DNA-binding protein